MADDGTTQDPAAVARAHRWRLWAEVDRRPSLWTVGASDPPHAEDCGCFSCGGWSFRAAHPGVCLCRVCQPQRWKGDRHRRLLRFVAWERAIYDAQRCAFGIYDLLPYVRRAGLDWLDAPELGESDAGGAGEGADGRADRSSTVVRPDARLFTEADLERLAGPARFERGRRLLDMVDDEYEDEYSLCATVTDGRAYLAMVHHRVGRLAGECDCPDAKAVPLCEHSVAVGLSYLSEGPDS